MELLTGFGLISAILVTLDGGSFAMCLMLDGEVVWEDWDLQFVLVDRSKMQMVCNSCSMQPYHWLGIPLLLDLFCFGGFLVRLSVGIGDRVLFVGFVNLCWWLSLDKLKIGSGNGGYQIRYWFRLWDPSDRFPIANKEKRR
ncbi:hypothetical protein M0R45_019613 [Rubus argutus]|uniref:Transmembrane protein n=1 Tax=Rubus argutus TaxID=59490 RepID=A0AAW1X7P6_RUBAR